MAVSEEEALKESLKQAVCGDDLEKTKELFARAAALFQDPAADITPAVMATALLRFAAECNAPDTARFLIAQGADVNLHLKKPEGADSGKGSFLQHALYYAAEKSAKALIEAGADLNARDDRGSTPLHYAVIYCHTYETAFRLIEKGADLHAQNSDGETPYGLMARNPNTKNLIDGFLMARAVKLKENQAAAEAAEDAAARAAFGQKSEKLKRRRPGPPFRKKP